MAGKKFSEFTPGVAVTSNTRIAGYVNGGTTNNIWTPTELAAGLQEHLLQNFIIACSDETTALTTGTKATFRMPYAFTLTAVRASLTTAGSTSGVTTIDINLGGSSIFTTNLLTIDQGDKTSVGATTAPNITTTALTDDGEITIDIDGLSGGATETGLKVTLIGYKTP
jgi:hypothetical protein